MIRQLMILAGLACGLTMPAQAGQAWSGAWGYAPADANPEQDAEQPAGVYRYRVTPSQSGDAVMLTFSNAEGDRDIAIQSATIALPFAKSGVRPAPASTKFILFNGGSAGAPLPKGRTLLSEPVSIAATAGQDFIVSVRFTTPTRPSRTNLGMPMAFASAEPSETLISEERFAPVAVRPYLSLIAVRTAAPRCTIVTFGDSITDGYGDGSPEVRGWPGRLASRLQSANPGKHCGVVNMGVSGNRVLGDGRGVNALDRFWRDVASVPGVTDVILLEGINDIGSANMFGNGPLDLPQLIDGYRQLAGRAHALGLKIYAGTLTPALGAFYMSDAKEQDRLAVNAFLRGDTPFDGILDFDAVVRDKAIRSRIAPEFDPGDHLHPNAAGYAAMGDAVPLALFNR